MVADPAARVTGKAGAATSYRERARWSRPLVLLLSLLLFAPVIAASDNSHPAARAPDSILFVGNSFTFYNNAIYTHLRGLLMAHDPATRQSILLKSMTISGGVLADHAGGLEQMLDLRPWDVVVLQGHSLEAIEHDRAPGFARALTVFSGRIRAAGARPVLFMTWAYADRPDMTPRLDEAFTRLGAELDLEVVPVGLAFARALEEMPGLALHTADKIHPSLAGTYLAAAVFYAALYDRSPENLDYDAGLPADSARRLRAIAWSSVLDYRNRR